MTVDCVHGVQPELPRVLDDAGLLAMATKDRRIELGEGKDDAELRHNDTGICYKKAADMDTMKYTRRTLHLVHMCHKTYRTRVELVCTQATHLHKCNLCETCAHIQLFAGEASGSPHNAKLSYNVIQKWRMT